MNNIYNVLQDRGYIYQSTHENEIISLLNGKKPITFYLGIDPTADSLHIGHFFALMMFRHLQDAGHKGILVIGGATALVGDPSGKNDMRKMLTHESVEYNINEVQKLAQRFIKTDGDNPAIILNNSEWINNYSYINFLRDIGTHFNINTMLATDTYANRLKQGGLTFLEMGYMLLQAYDFAFLQQNYGCTLQIGGSDQWGNIIAGVNLNRKLNPTNENVTIFGLTCPLLMTNEGKKMGKTEQGTLWVAREKTTVFDFYQYFYNVKDDDVEMLLKLFTRINLDEINNVLAKDIRDAKRLMAYEITKLVHGEDEANKVLDAVKSLFNNNKQSNNIPSYNFDKDKIHSKIGIMDLISEINFVPSKSEARRLILQGGISINGNKVTDIDRLVTCDDITENHILIKRGKKNFIKIEFN